MNIAKTPQQIRIICPSAETWVAAGTTHLCWWQRAVGAGPGHRSASQQGCPGCCPARSCSHSSGQGARWPAGCSSPEDGLEGQQRQTPHIPKNPQNRVAPFSPQPAAPGQPSFLTQGSRGRPRSGRLGLTSPLCSGPATRLASETRPAAGPPPPHGPGRLPTPEQGLTWARQERPRRGGPHGPAHGPRHRQGDVCRHLAPPRGRLGARATPILIGAKRESIKRGRAGPARRSPPQGDVGRRRRAAGGVRAWVGGEWAGSGRGDGRGHRGGSAPCRPHREAQFGSTLVQGPVLPVLPVLPVPPVPHHTAQCTPVPPRHTPVRRVHPSAPPRHISVRPVHPIAPSHSPVHPVPL